MDRTLVHSSSEIEDFNELITLTNVPFELIPRGFIEPRTGWPYPYEWFEKHITLLNNSNTYWNLLAFNKEGEHLAFVWGTWEPIEQLLNVIRIAIHPSMYKIDGKFLSWLLTKVRWYASSIKANKVFWVSNNWKFWLRKLDGLVEVDEARVVTFY